jgi:hypothetical protein
VRSFALASLALGGLAIGLGACDQEPGPPTVGEQVAASGDCDLADPARYAYLVPAFRAIACVDHAGDVTSVAFDDVTLPSGEFQYFPVEGGAVVGLYGAWADRFESRVARVLSGGVRLVSTDGPPPSRVFRSGDGPLFTTSVTPTGSGYALTLRVHGPDLSVSKAVSVGVGPNDLYVRNAALRGARAVLSANALVPDGRGGVSQATRTTLVVVDLDAGTVTTLDTDAPLTSNVVLVGAPAVLYYAAFQENVVYRRDLEGGPPERVADFGPVSGTYSAAQVVQVGPDEAATLRSDEQETRVIVFGADGSVARSALVAGGYRGLERSADGGSLCLRRYEGGWPGSQGSPSTETFAVVEAQSLTTVRTDSVPLGEDYQQSRRFVCRGA